jgi:hypothetical protein
MVKSTIYKGIEFVRVSQLTKQELEVFNKTFNEAVLIKIRIDEEIVHDCIPYRDYVLWYDSSFVTASTDKASNKVDKASKKKSGSSHKIVEVN